MMDDRFTKYIKLYILIFLLFLSVPVIISLIIGLVYGFTKIISIGPAESIFEILVLSMPVIVFTTTYAIFFSRTKNHPITLVKGISYGVFSIGLILCIFYLTRDLVTYFRSHQQDITDYGSFSTLFLAGNIATLFLVAILQAFSTSKEKDWLEKANEKEYH